jgi:hemolysin III
MRALRDPFSGLSHAFGLVLGACGSIWLFAQAQSLGARIAIAVYAACLVALYAASTLYHLVDAGEHVTRRLRLFDHSAIFLFVAGTSTPVLFHGLRGGQRVIMLSLLWGLAVIGVGLKVFAPSAPRALSTAMYVGMGWSVVVVAPALVAALSPACLACVAVGGVVYTAGAVVYATKWPDPRPPVFGFHEVWHLFVLAGSALHFAAIALLA